MVASTSLNLDFASGAAEEEKAHRIVVCFDDVVIRGIEGCEP